MNGQTQDAMIVLEPAVEWTIVPQHVDWRIAQPREVMMAAGQRGLLPFIVSPFSHLARYTDNTRKTRRNTCTAHCVH